MLTNEQTYSINAEFRLFTEIMGLDELEPRAVVSLNRLWQQQGKKAEARQMLAEVYDWFTEGFDTADLIEAKVLLEALA